MAENIRRVHRTLFGETRLQAKPLSAFHLGPMGGKTTLMRILMVTRAG